MLLSCSKDAPFRIRIEDAPVLGMLRSAERFAGMLPSCFKADPFRIEDAPVLRMPRSSKRFALMLATHVCPPIFAPPFLVPVGVISEE